MFFFLYLLSSGDMEGGIEHLTNAVSVCAQPNQLLQVLNQTLPPQIFQGIIARLPIICQVCNSNGLGFYQTNIHLEIQLKLIFGQIQTLVYCRLSFELLEFTHMNL